MLLAGLFAVIWVNAVDKESYDAIFSTQHGALSPHFVINEGLMTLFFLLVGLEIKRELISGELNTLRKASLPLVSAIGGMLVPALIYLFFPEATPSQSVGGQSLALLTSPFRSQHCV